MKPSSEKLPPHDDEAEASALACVMTANGNGPELLAQLSLEDFYDARHRIIFIVQNRLLAEQKDVGFISLIQRLKDEAKMEEAGGWAYVQTLPDKTPSPTAFPIFLNTLSELAIRRSVLRDVAELTDLAENPSVPARHIADASHRLLTSHAQRKRDADKLTIRRPNDILDMSFDDSDCIIGDRLFAAGQSLVIAGAGSIGKSRLLLQMAIATIAGKAFVSFEVHNPQLRWLILQAENSNRRLKHDLHYLHNWCSEEEWARVQEQLHIHTLESDCDGFLSLGDAGTQRRIAETIADLKPDVVAYDSLYNFAIGDLNSDVDMSETLLTLSRISRTGNSQRSIAVLHHARTGKAAAGSAKGYDRASFGRNSKVLHSWTRGQINVAPGSAENNEQLVVTCGKCSNGKEFSPFAIRLNPESLLYEPDPSFDIQAWEADVTGTSNKQPLMNSERVAEVCKVLMPKKELAKAIMDDCGCYRGSAYRYIERAVAARTIHRSKNSDTYSPK